MKKALVLVALVALLAGCTGTAGNSSGYGADSAAPTPVPSPTASAPPTSTSTTGAAPSDDQVTWAGQVCSNTETLQTDVQGLATAAASGAGNAAQAVADQVDVIKSSAGTLINSVQTPPVGTANDSSFSAVQDSVTALQGSLDTLETTSNQVQGTTGGALIDALAAVVGATGDALSDVGATVQAITAATRDASSTVGQAFRAAPECAALTG